MTNILKILVGMAEGKRSLGELGTDVEIFFNIKIHLTETMCDGAN
jgi:hypothetical protein